MIVPPQNANAHLASTWTAGIAVLFLCIGLQGAGTPLMPVVAPPIAKVGLGDEVMVEEFQSSPCSCGGRGRGASAGGGIHR